MAAALRAFACAALALTLVCPPELAHAGKGGAGADAGAVGEEHEYAAWLRSEFGARQPGAVDAALKALGTLSRKRTRLGPVLIHSAGASVGDKACLTWSIAAEYLKRQSPDAAAAPPAGQEECAQVQTLFMDDGDSVDSDVAKLCRAPCAERVVVVDGIAEATVERLEELLVRVLREGGEGVCAEHPSLSLARWVFFLVSELGHDRLRCPLASPAAQLHDAVKNAVRESAGLETLYGAKRATKSMLWQKGLKTLITFQCLGEGEVDTSRCADGKRPVARRSRKEPKRRPHGARTDTARGEHARAGDADSSSTLSAEVQRKLIVQCVNEWKAKKSLAQTRARTIEGLSDHFLGQELAVKRATNKLKNRQQGWGRRNKPLVMVFWGPSGTGKTELAKRLASIIHSDHPDALLASRKFVSIPMAQYQDKMSTANLVGPPVGIEGTGQLTGALLQEPTAVVLLDEFEKAHPEAISDVLLSALDGSGGLKDTKLNQYVPTNDATFILNTNVGASLVLERQADLESLARPPLETDDVVRDIDKALMEHLSKLSGRDSPFGKAEFRGRVDTWIPFLPYEFKHKCDVVVKALQDRVLSYYLNEAPAAQRFAIGWDQAAVELLAESYGGARGDQGFRPLLAAVDGVHDLLREEWEAGRLTAPGGALLSVSRPGLGLGADAMRASLAIFPVAGVLDEVLPHAAPASGSASTSASPAASFEHPASSAAAPSAAAASDASGELVAYAGSFESADTDGDGSISGAELAHYQRMHGGSGSVPSLDTDADGRISHAEWDAYTGSLESADADGDGSVSGVELARYQRTYGGSGSVALFQMDGDSVLSAAEFAAYAGSFSSADSDGDDVISDAELRKYNLVYGCHGSLAALDSNADRRLSQSEFSAYSATCPSVPRHTTSPSPSVAAADTASAADASTAASVSGLRDTSCPSSASCSAGDAGGDAGGGGGGGGGDGGAQGVERRVAYEASRELVANTEAQEVQASRSAARVVELERERDALALRVAQVLDPQTPSFFPRPLDPLFFP